MKTFKAFFFPTLKKIIRQPLKIWLLMASILFSALLALGIFTYFYYIKDISSPDFLMNRNNTGLVLSDRNGKTFYRSEGVKDFKPVELSNLPDWVKQATIAIEDNEFYEHPGLSLRGIIRSLYLNIFARSANRYGGSTITQQLVKNALLSPEKSFKRKFQEAILSVEVERRYSKDKILEMYLNSTYYGAGAYGIEEAAQTYFGKSASVVNIHEASLLAALPQAPSRYSPFGGDEELLDARKNLVLENMVEQGFINKDEKNTALKYQLKLASPAKELSAGSAPHFAVWVRNLLYNKYGENNVIRLGLHVRTSLDLSLQEKARDILTRRVKDLVRQKVTNGGVVILNPASGEILAMIGSVDWADENFGKFNIVFAKRQPGSSFKPLVYTKAFIDGTKTTDILHDKPTDFGGGYKPKNYDGRFRGEVTVRRALANSLNIPAVEILQKVGVKRAVNLVENMGISTLTEPDRYGLSLVLGGGDVELFELTRAYGVLANQGDFVSSHPYLSIEDKFGKTIYRFDPANLKEEDNFQSDNLFDIFKSEDKIFKEKKIGGMGKTKVINEADAYLTTHILKDDRARSEIFGSASTLLLPRPAAAKTGTTDDYRDSWTIGYTPQIVTGVWIGNNDNSPMERVAGSIGAAPIWHDVMIAALNSLPVLNFDKPPNIVEIEICADSLEKACESCENKYTEVFKKGTEPKNICPEDLSPTPSPTTEPNTTPQPSPTPEPTDEPTPTSTPHPTSTPIPIIQSPTPVPLPTTPSLIPTEPIPILSP